MLSNATANRDFIFIRVRLLGLIHPQDEVYSGARLLTTLLAVCPVAAAWGGIDFASPLRTDYWECSAMEITPNTNVTVEITTTPTSTSAMKTLDRLFRKDPEIAKSYRRYKEQRPSLTQKRRGGRWWNHRMRTKPNFTIEPGRSFSVRTTLDVVRDLESVERFVKVTAG
jgi:hypothetical protein